MLRCRVLLLLLGSTVFTVPALAQLAKVQQSIEIVNQIGAEGKGHKAAQAALNSLEDSPIEGLEMILAGIEEDKPLSRNWLRAAAATMVDRNRKTPGNSHVNRLVEFINKTSNSPAGRFAAFELLQHDDAKLAESLIPGMINDQSLDLRRLAVARAEMLASKLDDKPQKVAGLRAALSSARDVDQIESISDQLEELGEEVSLIQHFGFITKWKLVGPFEHAGSTEFDTVYPPEKELPPKFDASYDGKEGKVKWIDYATDDKFGVVDLNKALANHKGAITYAAAKFVAKEPLDVEIRMGCINGNKIWLNGKLLTANEVYHSNIAIDQYVGYGKLKSGENWILIKVAQNEQTESWAQRWQFQLRVCDKLGTPHYSLATR
ncbi:MAG: hypothetical protein AAF497_27090 [Planctomycetota bacterium]